ncbi:hypothetical protein BANRA_03751 [Acinetobacter baumannii]|nr:hypothetical protein BANRA_03751 [Acinetobacter baumannii]
MLKDLSQNLGQMNDKNNNIENFLKQIYENILIKIPIEQHSFLKVVALVMLR